MERRLNHLVDVALWSSKLSCVLRLEVHYEIEVVPNVVFLCNVELERNVLIFKITTGETCVYVCVCACVCV